MQVRSNDTEIIENAIQQLKKYDEGNAFSALLEQKADANELRNELLRILNLEDTSAQTQSNKEWFDAAYDFLLILAKYKPLNNLDANGIPECPVMLLPIPPEKRILTSTGYQFDGSHPQTLDRLITGNHPILNVPLSSRDIAYVTNRQAELDPVKACMDKGKRYAMMAIYAVGLIAAAGFAIWLTWGSGAIIFPAMLGVMAGAIPAAITARLVGSPIGRLIGWFVGKIKESYYPAKEIPLRRSSIAVDNDSQSRAKKLMDSINPKPEIVIAAAPAPISYGSTDARLQTHPELKLVSVAKPRKSDLAEPLLPPTAILNTPLSTIEMSQRLDANVTNSSFVDVRPTRTLN